MRVITDGGAVIDIGTVEAAPTIGIIDYSRRETDDFGVTTVVPRGFARQMSVRVKIATEMVDDVQRQLAALRATPATWIADDRFNSLRIEGFYKDFSIDLAIPPVSYCTLTIEGLAEDGEFVDPGTDPAPDQRPSTLRLLQPVDVSGAALTSSNVPETDYAGWSAGETYALGARVIKAATHRIYESAAADNVGNDPAGASGLWIDIGPTNRWAMFDQALGSATAAPGAISVALATGQTVNALALLDVIAASVRVQAGAYDRTQAPSAAPGMVTFLDMPDTSGSVTVTITGPGTVSVGTLLIGTLVGLGVTEAAPTAGITDYSRKETDGFGETTLVERAWAKRMNVRGLIRTEALDVVAGRIAAVRARPSLWIGDDSLESVTVYGFFKDFSIEVGDSVSFLALSIEGLSKAAKIAPIVPAPGWTDIVDDDPDHPKPEDGATVGAPPGTNVGDTPANTVAAALKAVALTTNPAEVVAGAQALAEAMRELALTADTAEIVAGARRIADAIKELALTADPAGIVAGAKSLADAMKELALTNDPSEIVAGAKALVDRARLADLGALDQLLINQERKDRFDRLTHMDGIPVGARVRQETIERISTDEALAARSTLIEATMTSNQLAVIAAIEEEAVARATADEAEASIRTTMIAQVVQTVDDNRTEALSAIEDEAIARADAIAAETLQRELAISTFQATVDGQIADVSAAIASEATTRAAADAAETATRTAQISTLTTGLSNANAAISAEASTRATADAAETAARELAISTLQTTVDGEIATVTAAIASEATTRADADAAETAIRTAQISILTIGLSDANAAITSEATTRAAADLAETNARTAAVSTLTTGLSHANAAITSEASTRAAADLAETSARNLAISNLETTVNGQISTVGAAIASEATTRATADAAETTARELAISELATDVDGQITTVSAAIASEATTRAAADVAEATTRAAQIATLTTGLSDANAAITSEASTRAAADLAETNARTAAVSTLTTNLAAANAAITSEASTRAAADIAETNARNLAISALDTDLRTDVYAAIASEATTRATADAAETTQRELAISELDTDIRNDVSAAIASEATTRATADTAEATTRAAQIATLTSDIASANAAITDEATTRAAADLAETSARNAAVSTLTTNLSAAHAAITAEATTRAAADQAETNARNIAISNLETELAGQLTTVSAGLASEATTRATADAAEVTAREGAIASLTTNLNGEISARQAAIIAEQSARATAITAEATTRNAQIASVESDIADVNAALSTEATTRATNDAAEVTARTAAVAALQSDIGDAMAAVISETTARVAADSALSSLITGVSTTVDANTSSVILLLESVDGLSAQLVAKVESDGVIGGFQLAGGGGVVDANFLVDNFRLLSRSGGDKWEYSDGRQRTIGGSIMTITGVPFGSANQFIEWTGPIVSNLTQCTEANAIKYVKTDGSAYFGGGLSSGILKNEATSTVVAADAFVAVGPFSSNGEPVNVNMSAVYARNQLANAGTASITGSGSGELVLRWSSDGSTWNYLTTIGASEYQRDVYVDGDPTVKDQMLWEMRAASTFTWTPGALNGIYISLSWTTRTTPAFNGTGLTSPTLIQRTTIIAVEQP